jgi:membrane protein YdbS with pleckstrin-like domain
MFTDALGLFKAGKFAEARDVLEKCLEEQPEHVGSLVGVALCLDRLEERPRAEAIMHRVLDLNPGDIQAHMLLAETQLSRDQTEDAIDHLRSVLVTDPNHAQARQLLTSLTTQQPSPPHHLLHPKPPADPPTPASALAQALDLPHATSDAVQPGRIVYQGRRRLTSFRRLWLGIALLAGGSGLLVWAHHLMATAPNVQRKIINTPGGSYSIVSDVAHRAATDTALLPRMFGWNLLILGIIGIVGAIANSILSRYVVREHRLEITEGFFLRVRRIIWLYRIQDVRLVQDPVLILAGTARLTIHSEEAQTPQLGKPRWWQLRRVTITGINSTAEMTRLMEWLHRRALHERRVMKKAFI